MSLKGTANKHLNSRVLLAAHLMSPSAGLQMMRHNISHILFDSSLMLLVLLVVII